MCALNTVPFVLRNFEKKQNDYSGVAQVATAVWPEEPTTASELALDDKHRKPDRIHGRVVAELNGQIIAFGVYGKLETSPRSREFFFNALVHPDHQCQGIGKAIYSYIIGALSQYKPSVLTTDTRENQTDAVRFLKMRGFEIVQRRPVLRLNVKSFDSARISSGKVHDKRQKITVSTLSELMLDVPDWKHRCWDLDWEIVQDIPSPDAPARSTFESYALHFDNSDFTPQSWFIALQGDEWVGMSIIDTNPSTPDVFYTSVTGVRRGFRRRGIAMALKLHGIEHVRALGGQFIETDNDENSPMLNLNLTLGFERGPAILEFRKTFSAADP